MDNLFCVLSAATLELIAKLGTLVWRLTSHSRLDIFLIMKTLLLSVASFHCEAHGGASRKSR